MRGDDRRKEKWERNKYFKLKNSWGCHPNSKYLLFSHCSGTHHTHVGHCICKQCDHEHSENLASVVPFVSLRDWAQIVQQIVLGINLNSYLCGTIASLQTVNNRSLFRDMVTLVTTV